MSKVASEITKKLTKAYRIEQEERTHVKDDDRIDWQSLTRDEAKRLSDIQVEARRQKKHLAQASRSTVENEARAVGVENPVRMNLPELRARTLAREFTHKSLPLLDRIAAKEVI